VFHRARSAARSSIAGRICRARAPHPCRLRAPGARALNPGRDDHRHARHGFDAGFSILTSNAQAPRGAVSGWFRAHGREARVLVLMPGHSAPARSRAGSSAGTRRDPDGDGVRGVLRHPNRRRSCALRAAAGTSLRLARTAAVAVKRQAGTNSHEHIGALMSQPGADLSRNLRNRHISSSPSAARSASACFLGSAKAIHNAGPGLLLAYAWVAWRFSSSCARSASC